MKLHIKSFRQARRHEEKILAGIFRIDLSALESRWFNEYYQSFFFDHTGCVLAGGFA